MAFDLNIKNIGKLSDAKIRIGQFTVFAGQNNTGKSFVSKIMYSIFNAMNANHAEVCINNLTSPIRNRLRRLARRELPDNEDSPVIALIEEVENLETLVKESPIRGVVELDKIIPDIVNRLENMQTMLPDIDSYIRSINYPQLDIFPSSELVDRVLRDVERLLTDFQKTLRKKNANDLIISGIGYKIGENLIQNFQVPRLADLSGVEDQPSEIIIDGLGKFQFSNGDVDSSIEHAGLRQLQQYSEVIYLESPVYWKLRNALENVRFHPRYLINRRERLSGVPGYFYDLASKLKYEYTGDIAFPDLYEKLTSKEIIGGKIVLSESGNLSFQENGRSFSLPVTAMGIANLGILALLIEHKVLNEDSFLFIDEPEAHLHPGWQVVMADTLFELARRGVNVVIATHSADILKWLEVHVKKNPDDENLIALNKFPANGNEPEDQDFDDKIAAIKQELTKPFADLYTKGL